IGQMTQVSELKEDKKIDFYVSPKDSGHIIVSRFLPDRSREIIGHVYIEVDGDEIRYICTNQKKREIFPPTTDFNTVDVKYQRYADLLTMKQLTNKNYQALINNKNNL